mmetsp:Transcript_25528/g.33366  ORF Transcript_25528/g.33366 Transcript_25528/m.33366 type:complete len:250 (+) Transcript_25528:150-899(+)
MRMDSFLATPGSEVEWVNFIWFSILAFTSGLGSFRLIRDQFWIQSLRRGGQVVPAKVTEKWSYCNIDRLFVLSVEYVVQNAETKYFWHVSRDFTMNIPFHSASVSKFYHSIQPGTILNVVCLGDKTKDYSNAELQFCVENRLLRDFFAYLTLHLVLFFVPLFIVWTSWCTPLAVSIGISLAVLRSYFDLQTPPALVTSPADYDNFDRFFAYFPSSPRYRQTLRSQISAEQATHWRAPLQNLLDRGALIA